MNYKKILLGFLMLFPILIVAQIGGEDEVYLTGDRVEAKFRGGGIDKFSEFIHQEFNYSKVTKAGQMIAAFTVDVDGSIKKIKLIKMLDVESATEMIRVLNKCPKWEPAKRGGKPISIEIKYPMSFNVKLPESQPKLQGAQTTDTKEISEPTGKVFELKDIPMPPKFTGGIGGFYNYIAKNFQVPEKEGLAGKVIVNFIVEIDGSLSNIEVTKDIGYGTKQEAIRVMKESPKWSAGRLKGKPVRVSYTLPINIHSK